MARLTKRESIGVRVEVTQGTYLEPVNTSVEATGYFFAEGVEITLNSENLERNYFRTTLDPIAIVKGKKSAELKFKCELLAGATTAESSVMKALFNGCGLIDATAGTYLPISTPPANFSSASKSCSFQVFKDGTRHRLNGCVGDVKFSFEAGKIIMCEFSFKGILQESTFGATEAIPAIFYHNNAVTTAISNIVAKGQSFTFAGDSDYIVPKIEISMGNEIVERANIEATHGVEGFALIGRKPMMNISIEAPAFATHDVIGLFEAGTSGSAIVNVTKYTFTLAAAQVISANYTDIGGILGHDVGFQLNTSAGDDCITIVESES